MGVEEYSKDEAVTKTDRVDEHTIEPDAAAGYSAEERESKKKWEMPEPVFRQTSGYLPQGFVKQIEDAAALAPNEETIDANAGPGEGPNLSSSNAPVTPLPVPKIKQQPHVSDQSSVKDLTPGAALAPVKSGELRMLLIILGLLAVAVFISAFLIFVYRFLAEPGETNNF